MKSTFENQNKIRLSNQLTVYELLKNGDYSCTDLAKMTGLSNTALANIVSDLENAGIIKIAENKIEKLMGRKPIYYELNTDFGLFAAIDMTHIKMEIVLADIKGNIIAKEYYKDTLYIDKNDILQMINILSEMLNLAVCKSRPLKSICIGTPGKINSQTGAFIFAPRFPDYTSINLRTLFNQTFDAPIILKNDIKLALMGESAYGVTKNMANAIFLHIDHNFGGAILLNNSILEGENGFAGELGELRALGDSELRYSSNYFTTSGIVLEAQKHFQRDNLKEELTFSDIAALYSVGDENICKVVSKAAEATAIIINNLVSIFDIGTYVLGGKITALGDKYIAEIENYLRKYYDNSSIIEIRYSALKGEATIWGGISFGTDYSVNEMLLELRK